jgi:hypothetical protein
MLRAQLAGEFSGSRIGAAAFVGQLKIAPALALDVAAAPPRGSGPQARRLQVTERLGDRAAAR